jgi:hypothetical protein
VRSDRAAALLAFRPRTTVAVTAPAAAAAATPPPAALAVTVAGLAVTPVAPRIVAVTAVAVPAAVAAVGTLGTFAGGLVLTAEQSLEPAEEASRLLRSLLLALFRPMRLVLPRLELSLAPPGLARLPRFEGTTLAAFAGLEGPAVLAARGRRGAR